MCHDKWFGFPVYSDNELFGRLIFEINQAGLSWNTILLNENNFREAFDDFSIEKIAQYDERKIAQLMQNSGIIKNNLKIRAVIHNAQFIQSIQHEFGSFKYWLDSKEALSLREWTKLFKCHFKFTGEKIIEEFLISTGYLKGANSINCIIFDDVIATNPKWLTHEKN